MRLLSAEESRRVDRLSQQKFGVPSYQLMSRAGEAVALALTRKWPDAARQPVMVVCGKGNNGGDGMVAARFLANRGANIKVGLLARISDLEGDAARAAADLISASGQIQEISEPAALASFFSEPPALIVDAIFGTGLNAAVEGLPREAIETISRIERPVISVDIASGVNADTAEIMGVAIKA